jgi:hypothetical protein
LHAFFTQSNIHISCIKAIQYATDATKYATLCYKYKHYLPRNPIRTSTDAGATDIGSLALEAEEGMDHLLAATIRCATLLRDLSHNSFLLLLQILCDLLYSLRLCSTA